MSELPIAVIGAGPQGLAAAAHWLERGIESVVLEAGETAAAGVSAWGHVRMFSPWSELIDPAGARLMEPSGWQAPQEGYPTGAEWVGSYLAPLATALGDRLRYGTRVVGVSRRGRDRLVSAGRENQPFVIHVIDRNGAESRFDARAVIDASGTWGQPNPVGADGLPAIGEREAANAGAVFYVPPTPEQGAALAGRHVVVVGSGHSAMTAVIELAAVAKANPGTKVTLVLRRGVVDDNTFGGGEDDALPQRGALGLRSREAVDAGLVTLVTGFRVEQVETVDGKIVLVSEDGRSLPAADHVVALTGFRPDLTFLTELRLDLDPILQAPAKLAPEIDPNLHSCGSVMPHGARELAHPEAGLYVVGMKSYGRAPTFLAMTGYEQVRSVAAELAGDHDAARRVELVLPDTGVCGGAGLFDEPAADNGGGCCGAPAAPPTLSVSLVGNPATA